MKRSRTTPMTSGDEYDAFSKRARRALCVFFNNTGLIKYWQRKYNAGWLANRLPLTKKPPFNGRGVGSRGIKGYPKP